MEKSKSKPRKRIITSKELNVKLIDFVKNSDKKKDNIIDYLSELVLNELLKDNIVAFAEFKLEFQRNGQPRKINRVQKFGGDENNQALVEIKPRIKTTLSKDKIKYIKENIPTNE